MFFNSVMYAQKTDYCNFATDFIGISSSKQIINQVNKLHQLIM